MLLGSEGFVFFWLKTTGKSFPLSLSFTLQLKMKCHVRCWRMIFFLVRFDNEHFIGHQLTRDPFARASFEKWHVVDTPLGRWQVKIVPRLGSTGLPSLRRCCTKEMRSTFRISDQRSDAKKVTLQTPPNGTPRVFPKANLNLWNSLHTSWALLVVSSWIYRRLTRDLCMKPNQTLHFTENHHQHFSWAF